MTDTPTETLVDIPTSTSTVTSPVDSPDTDRVLDGQELLVIEFAPTPNPATPHGTGG